MQAHSSDIFDPPLVSAVIPAYNCERYVGRAIRSVLAQTYPNVECIVVNDGSTDRTASVIASFGERLRVITQGNGGASAARNAGIQAARGRYIAFVDSDDYWLPTKLELQLAVLRNDPELVLVSSALRWIRSPVDPEYLDTDAPTFEPERLQRYDGLDHLVLDPYLGTSTIVVDARAAKEVGGFDTSLPIAEDVDFYFRVCATRPYAILYQELARCQLRAGSLTTTQPHGHVFTLRVLDRLVQARPEFAASHEATLRSRRLAIYSEWVRSLIYCGEGRSAREVLERSRSAGRLPEYSRLYLKSVFAPAIRIARRLRRQMNALTRVR